MSWYMLCSLSDVQSRCLAIPCCTSCINPSSRCVHRGRPMDWGVALFKPSDFTGLATETGIIGTVGKRDSRRKCPLNRPICTYLTAPQRTPLSFRQAHVSAMQAKLYQFDQALRNEIVRYDVSAAFFADHWAHTVHSISGDVSAGAQPDRRYIYIPHASRVTPTGTSNKEANRPPRRRHHPTSRAVATITTIPSYVVYKYQSSDVGAGD